MHYASNVRYRRNGLASPTNRNNDQFAAARGLRLRLRLRLTLRLLDLAEDE